ncbi:YaaW family protein [Gloeocapsa sp. PCC 73106]|uniref:YaaW family protein n=1 Tax=Gloeocapsa sp. PCC 73106 TaxID=102232 RepID=UPI0002ACAE02|nr:YaaW family protein [Gloeocapsa sp. PCC 73106]ELR99480.1 hypothetical protein GLO73106DRAFT_00033320 [Gloeocapsa sp. PCC 73106]
MDELRKGLELATEEELQQLTRILFARGINPLDYWKNPLPLEVQSQDWEHWLDLLEKRFRYLAADALTVLKGRTHQVSYRQTLIQVCHYLKIAYSQSMSTIDIEAEIFLHLLSKAWYRLPVSEKKALSKKFNEDLETSGLAPDKNYDEFFKIILKGSSVWAVNSVLKPWILKQIAVQIPVKTAIESAKRGIIVTTARYAAVRSALTLIGPILWASLLTELGWKAIAVNYSRILPVIFTLAQIRLTRGECWELA